MEIGPTSISDRFRPALAGPDPDAIVHRQDEDLAVADLAVGTAPTRLDDRVDGRLDEVLVDGDLELDLAEQVDRKLVASVDFRISLLSPEALTAAVQPRYFIEERLKRDLARALGSTGARLAA